jgi:uncharacterized membrane protein YgcG
MFLRKVVLRALLALLVSVGPLLFVTAPARALTACDTEVVDGGRFFAGWVDTLAGGSPITDAHSKVQDAAGKLREAGVTVRVVTLTNGDDRSLTPDSTLRKWCPAWFDGDNLKSDYIVFAAVDDMGVAGISYGSKWADTLGPQLRGRTVAEQINEEIMTPPFYDHQYAVGFVNAINETYRIITGGAVTTPPAPFYEKRHMTSLVEVENHRKWMIANAGPTSPVSSTVSEGYWSPWRVSLLAFVAALGLGSFLLFRRRQRR